MRTASTPAAADLSRRHELHYDRRVARGKTVLIVEDDELLSRLYRTALSVAGYDVRHAPDGLQALRDIDGDPPDLVVLDLGLPHVDGIAVRQEIAAHAHTRDIPIVVVTGSTMDLTTLDVPCILRKPVAPDELVEAVRRCLHSGAMGA
jgi:two-component system KDP operon response regulator KdpE